MKTTVPQTEKKELKKESVTHKLVPISSIGRVVLAVVSFASMVLGTYLIISGVLGLEYGSLTLNSLAIFHSNHLTGDAGDLFFVVAGIGLWILGSIGLTRSFKKDRPERSVLSNQT